MPTPVKIPDNIKYGPRAPRLTVEAPYTAPLAFVEVPSPSPDLAVSIVDSASGTIENSQSRGIEIQYNGETSNVDLLYNGSTGFLSNIGSSAVNTQQGLTVPIKILRVEEDAASSWHPILSRGMFYKVWKMNSTEGPTSWLGSTGADYQNGQYLLLGYSSELDWQQICQSDQWTGTGVSGGGGIWNVKQHIAITQNSQSLSLLPSGLGSRAQSAQVLALGGITTSTGTELLTEPARSTAGVLQAPGLGTSGLTNNVLCEVYPGSFGDVTTGRQATTSPYGYGYETSWDYSPKVASDLISTYAPTSGYSANQTVIKFSGAFLVQQEGYYTFNFELKGKMLFTHWNLSVIDRWFGNPAPGVTRSNSYSAYLHTGWHNFSIQWAPDNDSDTFNWVVPPLSESVLLSPDPTTRSQVQSIDSDTGEVTLSSDYLALQSSNPPEIRVTYAAVGDGLPYRGYYNNAGGFVSLDLNPGVGRQQGLDNGTSTPGELPTRSWALNASCWLYCIPSIACALTDASGLPYSTGTRNWVSSTQYGITGTIRWAQVLSPLTVGISIKIPFGIASNLQNGQLGQSTFGSQGTTSGTLATDPRGDYNSASILGHLDVTAALPTIRTLLVHDVRSRGGGLTHNINPAQLPTGGPQERANTFWDLSPTDGYETAIDGIAIVQVPSAVLTGTDGGPIFTTKEVEDLVNQTIATGIKPVIQYI